MIHQHSITIEYDSTGTDTAATVDITIYQPDKDQYFDSPQPDRISIKTSVKPKSIKVNQAKKKEDGKAIESNVKNIKTDEKKKDEKTVIVDKSKSKASFKISWWMPIGLLLLIFLLILAYKNRTPIGNWIKNIFSLIKFI